MEKIKTMKNSVTGELKKYDEKGNIIYRKDPQGYEERMEYNENGNCTHCKNSDGFEEWWKYDSNGMEIDYWCSSPDCPEGEWLECEEND